MVANRRLVTVCVAVMCLPGGASAEIWRSPTPACSPCTIDLTNDHNLSAIFDAGLRPWRVPRAETHQCSIEWREQLRVVLPNGRSFELTIRRADMSVVANNELSFITLFGEDEGITSAIERVRGICHAAGIPSESFERVVAGLAGSSTGEKRWFKAAEVDDVRVSITFDPLDLGNRIVAGVLVQLNYQPSIARRWKKQGSIGPEYVPLTEPIQPPRGYEHVSMDPPTPQLWPTNTPTQLPPGNINAGVRLAVTPTITASPTASPRPSIPLKTPSVTPAAAKPHGVLDGGWAKTGGFSAIAALITC